MTRRSIPLTGTLLRAALLASSTGIAGAAEDASKDQAPAAFRGVHALCLAFSSDSSLVATGGSRIYIHDIESGRQIDRLSPPPLTRAVAFSPSTTELLASGSDDGAVRLWRLGNAKPLSIFNEHSGMVGDVAFSPDGELLASCALGIRNGQKADGELIIRNVRSGQVVHSIKYPEGGIEGVAFSRTGDRLAFARNTGGRGTATARIDIYDTSDWDRIQRIDVAPGFALSLAFAPNENKLVIAGGECIPLSPASCMPTGHLWIAELGSKRPAQQLDVVDRGYFRSVSFVPGGELFATGAQDRSSITSGSVQLWSTLTRQVVWAAGNEPGDPYGATISPDGKLVGACWASGVVQLFDARNGSPVRSIDLTK